MGTFKAYILGVLSAYGVYYITRKGADGRSILDELLARPDVFMRRAKGEILADTAKVVKDIVS